MVYLPTFTIKNQPNVGKYAVRPMDGTGTTKWEPADFGYQHNFRQINMKPPNLTQSWIQEISSGRTVPERTLKKP